MRDIQHYAGDGGCRSPRTGRTVLAGALLAAALTASAQEHEIKIARQDAPAILPGHADRPYTRADFQAGRAGVVHAHELNGNDAVDRAAIDAGLDELDLLDPDLSPEEVTRLLGDMVDGQDQPQGGPTATGYELHRKWGVNGLRDDAFSGSTSGTYRGRAAARLANGDVVVVGDILGSGVSTQTNLGLVRYNSRGQRVAWPNAGAAFAHFTGYLRFPGTDAWGSTRDVFAVHDVKVRNGNIYALITMTDDEPGGGYHPAIIRFRDDGSFGGWWFATPDGATIRDAVAMDIHGNNMIVLGRRTLTTTGTDGGFWTIRATINADGGLTFGAMTTFFAGQRIVPADVAFRRIGIAAVVAPSPPYYVAYTRNLGTTATSDHDACIARINSSNALDTGFSGDGWECRFFDEGGNNIEQAVAVHTRGWTAIGPGGTITNNEAMYMIGEVERTFANGTGIWNYTNGQPDANFGAGGRRLYGGCGTGDIGEGCNALALFRDSAHIPRAIHSLASPQGVYITGHRIGGLVTSEPTTRPFFMDVNASSGALRSIDVLGSAPNSVFTDLVPRGSTGEFTLAGWGSSSETSSSRVFLSGHVVRKSDLIFYDGLQTP